MVKLVLYTIINYPYFRRGIMKILLVDDEEEILELLSDFLELEEYSVITARNVPDATNKLREHPDISCILLDVMMPHQSGYDFCKVVRQTSDIPILFLSARQEDTDKVRGLRLGADDYIVKSATPIEIIARIQAVMRRYQKGQVSTEKELLQFGELVINIHSYEVWVNKQFVPFTSKEFEILLFLAENPKQVFSHEQIYLHIWKDEYFDIHTVRVHVSRLREKLKKSSSKNEKWIYTVWGVGYKFEGDDK